MTDSFCENYAGLSNIFSLKTTTKLFLESYNTLKRMITRKKIIKKKIKRTELVSFHSCNVAYLTNHLSLILESVASSL